MEVPTFYINKVECEMKVFIKILRGSFMKFGCINYKVVFLCKKEVDRYIIVNSNLIGLTY